VLDCDTMSRLPLLVLLLCSAVASGCGSECASQSIPHCPGPGGAECINGEWHCFLYDLPASAPPLDFSAPRDLSLAD